MGGNNPLVVITSITNKHSNAAACGRKVSQMLAPMRNGLFEGDEEKAWNADALDLSVGPERDSLDKLRTLGVSYFTLAVVVYTPPDDTWPLQYPSLTGYSKDRTYSAEELSRIRVLQESITALVVESIWDVLPDEMRDGDAVLVRLRVDLGEGWESTKIVGYAGAIRIMYGLHNEPFILK